MVSDLGGLILKHMHPPPLFKKNLIQKVRKDKKVLTHCNTPSFTLKCLGCCCKKISLIRMLILIKFVNSLNLEQPNLR